MYFTALEPHLSDVRIFKGPGFAETLLSGSVEGRRVIRKVSNKGARPFSRVALIREIRLLSELNESLRSFFPEIIRTNLGDRDEHSDDLPQYIFYDMPYYAPEDGWMLLSSLLFEGILDRTEVQLILDKIVSLVIRYLMTDNRSTPPDYAETTMLRAIRESLDWAVNEPELDELTAIGNMKINDKPVLNVDEFREWFEDTGQVREIVTPHVDRFLHGDFFPENILYNLRTHDVLLMDPVSVRGVHRGDALLDLYKMEQWLDGELPALRQGLFKVGIDGSNVRFSVKNAHESLYRLHRYGLSGRWRAQIEHAAFADILDDGSDWRARRRFIAAFYAFCMLPLTDISQARARYLIGVREMNRFISMVGA